MTTTETTMCFRRLHEMTEDNMYWRDGRSAPTCRACRRASNKPRPPLSERARTAQNHVKSIQIPAELLANPEASAHNQAWSDRAACRTEDPDLFFPASDEGSANQPQIRDAKTVCSRCPVIDQCRSWALATGYRHGIAGGLTETERREMNRSTPKREVQRVIPADVDPILIQQLMRGERPKATLDEKLLAVRLLIKLGVARQVAADAVGISGHQVRLSLGEANS